MYNIYTTNTSRDWRVMLPKVFDTNKKTHSDIRKIQHGDKVKVYRQIGDKKIQTHEGTVDGSAWSESIGRRTSWYIALQGNTPANRRRGATYSPTTIDVSNSLILVAKN